MTAPGDDEAVLPEGTRLGSYRIERPIGAGGMGRVYLARHEALGRLYALKTLRDPRPDAHVRARLAREALAAARITHPHVLSPTDLGETGDVVWFVAPYLEGETLEARLAAGPLEPAPLLDLLLPVLSAVAAAHDEGVVHRDLKPANVFLERGPSGEVPYVLDFGIAKRLDDASVPELTSSWALLGTPHYAAPEQIERPREADARADQYALGAILYEGLAGRRPIEADSLYALLRRVGTGDVPDLRAERPTLPAALAAAVHRALAVDPAARFASVRALGRALLPFASPATQARWRADFFDRASHVPEAAPPPHVPSPAPRRGAAWTRGVAGLFVVGGLAGAALAAWIGGAGSRAPAVAAPAAAAPRERPAAVASPPPPSHAPPTPAPTPRTAAAPTAAAAPAPGPAPTPAETVSVRVEATAPDARFTLDGEPAGRAPFERSLPRDGTRHTLRVEAPGHLPRTFSFTADAPPPRRVRLDPLPRRRPPPADDPPVGANQAPILD